MCGRFTLKANPNELAEAFPEFSMPDAPSPRYNIAPSQPVLAAANDGQNKLALFRWGLIPAWAKDASIGQRMINARAETLAEKPAFRAAYRRRRCLILADGFYEWRSEPGRSLKTPMYIHLASGRPFAFAGLWEAWRLAGAASPGAVAGAETLFSCAIITTEPNALMENIHNRMPVILNPQDYAAWLEPAEREPGQLAGLLKPYPAAEMVAYPVSRLVNDPKRDTPECIMPAGQNVV